jgi:Probable cobalt transporter subunit (CbtB)
MTAQPAALPASPVPVSVSPIPIREIAPWAILTVLLSLVVLYFVSSEQGATALFSGAGVHEFLHDGRHLLGFPCH